MSSFAPRAAASAAAQQDQTKHVNYNLGMVLGVDDFTQEFAYFSGRDQWMSRDLLGYGTACGLRVTIETEGTGGPQVLVTPGAAVSPRGQLIRVKPTQAAYLNDWLALEKNKPTLDAIHGNQSRLSLYVVLCYRECKTDQVPIPGEPCRSEEESMAASRVADDFALELRFDAPDQREEDAMRDFVAWLGQMEISDEVGVFATREQFEEEIRNAAHLLTSPPASPLDFMYGSLPASLRIRTADACEYLRAAFRIWITELRPIWLGQGQTASGQLPKEECLLLAELNVPILKAGTQWSVDDSLDVQIDEQRRPFLLHLRMVQEWVECGRRERSPADTVKAARQFNLLPNAGTSHAYSRADHTHGTPFMAGDVTSDESNHTTVEALMGVPLDRSIASPLDDRPVMLYEAGMWKAAPAPPIPLGGDVSDMSNANQIVQIQGIRLIIERTGGDRILDGQVLTFFTEEGHGPHTDGGGGDKSLTAPLVADKGDTDSSPPGDSEGASADSGGILPPADKDSGGDGINPGDESRGVWKPSYVRIQGQPVAGVDEDTRLFNGQVLTYREDREGAGTWIARDAPSTSVSNLSGDVSGPSELTRVEALQGVELFIEPDNLREGQVLAVVKPRFGSDVPFRLEPVDMGGLGGIDPGRTLVTTLKGDVAGPTGNTAVERIRGIEVAPTEDEPPEEDQVLTFFKGRWMPRGVPASSSGAPAPGDFILKELDYGMDAAAGVSDRYSREDHTHGTPPLPNLDGDVTGRADSNTVARLQGVPLVGPNEVPYTDGSVLTFRDKTWVPEPASTPSPNSVQHPGAGPYAIVAAGIIKGDGTVRGGIGYNGLTVSPTGAGRLTLTFNGYENPDKAAPESPFFYIVKALPLTMPDTREKPILSAVFFETYQQRSLVLRVIAQVADQAIFIDPETLAQMEFMIEISRYDLQFGLEKQ
jgi:hypothetical protein